jgi:hypothetical protein
MKIEKRGKDTFAVGSESSDRNYLVAWGTEGDFYSCTCTAYAIGRNRAGGLGYPFDCKHVRAVKDQFGDVSEKSTEKVTESLLALAASLRPEGK